MNDSKVNELADQADAPNALVAWNDPGVNPLAVAAKVWCTLTPRSDADRVRIMDAMQGSTLRLSEAVGQKLAVRDVLIHTVSLTDADTGEVSEAKRIVLFTGDGRLFSCVSSGVLKSLAYLAGIWSQPPWNPPLPVKVGQLTTGGKNRYLILEYAGKGSKATDGLPPG